MRFPWVSALLMRLLTQPPLLASLLPCPTHSGSQRLTTMVMIVTTMNTKVTMMVLSNLLIKTHPKTKMVIKLDEYHK